MKYKQHLTLYLFVGSCVLLSSYSYLGNFDAEKNQEREDNKSSQETLKKLELDDSSVFLNLNYFLIHKGKKSLELNSSKLTVSDENNLFVGENPHGILYRYDEKKDLHSVLFKSKLSTGVLSNSELHLSQDVEIIVDTAKLSADQLDIFNNGKMIEAKGSVRTSSFDRKTNDQILVTSKFAIYRPDEEMFEYRDDVKGVIKRKREYEQSVNFGSNSILVNGREGLMEMNGKVSFSKGNLKAMSNKGVVYLENYNKRLKYYSLSDDVRLEESLKLDSNKVIRKAFAEKLEGIVSEQKIILTGLPKVFQGRDVIKGNRIVIRENVETVEVDDANSNIILNRDN